MDRPLDVGARGYPLFVLLERALRGFPTSDPWYNANLLTALLGALVQVDDLARGHEQRSRRLRIDLHVQEHQLHLGELGDGLPELLAFARVLHRLAKRGFADALRLRGRIVVAPSIDYLDRVADASKYGRISEAPWLEATIPSLVDPLLVDGASGGGVKHVMSIIAQSAPYALRESTWDDEREALGDLVVRTLERAAPGVSDLIVARELLLGERGLDSCPNPVKRAKTILALAHLAGDHASLDELIREQRSMLEATKLTNELDLAEYDRMVTVLRDRGGG